MERLVLNPRGVFKDQFPGWGPFLGNGKPKQRSAEEWVAVAENLAANQGGVLPQAYWLIKNGYCGLYNAMKQFPEFFNHIKQTRPKKSVAEWVLVAESLADEHRGVLPHGKWLTRNGYNGLEQAMRRQPEAFAHIEQEKPYGCRLSPQEWVSVAEGLAERGNGAIPCKAWLLGNGYNGLYQAKRKYPELFQHLRHERRDSKGRLIKDRGEAA